MASSLDESVLHDLAAAALANGGLPSDEPDEDDDDEDALTPAGLGKLYGLLSAWVAESKSLTWEQAEAGFRAAMEAVGAGCSARDGSYAVGGWTLAIASWSQVLTGTGALPKRLRSEAMDRWDDDDDEEYDEDEAYEDEDQDEDEDGAAEPAAASVGSASSFVEALAAAGDAEPAPDPAEAWNDPALPVPEGLDRDRFARVLERLAEEISGG